MMTRKILLSIAAVSIVIALALGVPACGFDCDESPFCGGGPPDHCSDDKKSGDETDVDCGGSCGRCADGLACESKDDCDSRDCSGNVCVSVCGDGFPQYSADEKCDDGNTAGGDGCDPTCQVETGLICSPNVCYLQGQHHAKKVPYPGDLADTSEGFVYDGTHVARDGSGNILWTGSFSGTVNFGGADISTPDGHQEVFLVKYDADGNHVWSKSLGENPLSQGGIGADASGNVLLTGSFSDAINLGGGPLSTGGSAPGTPNSDVFVAKFDAADGHHLWSRGFGGSESDSGHSVAADPSGNVLVTGRFKGTVDFGGSSISASDQDVFVVKYDANGNYVWSAGFGGNYDQGGSGVTVDASGNSAVTGYYSPQIDFGEDSFSAGEGSLADFLAKLDSSGHLVWGKSFDTGPFSPSGDFFRLISTDGSGNMLVIGGLLGTLNCGGGDLISAGSYDIFMVQYDADGNHLWSTRFINAEYQTDFSVGTDSSGKILVTGFVP